MISDRQKNILLAIVEEFMKNADEVGSTFLIKHHNLGVSSATIRSEMVRLMDEGMLEKSHASSGRIPTDQALRLYVQENANKNRISPMDEIEINQGIFRVRFSQDQLIGQLLDIIVDKCKSAAFYLTDDYQRYYGVSSLMRYGEMRDVEVLQRVLDVLEDENLLRRVFTKYEGDSSVSLIIGNESGIKDLENCSLAFTKVRLGKERVGHIGVIGPRRLDYQVVIPVLNTLRNSVEQSLKGWM